MREHVFEVEDMKIHKAISTFVLLAIFLFIVTATPVNAIPGLAAPLRKGVQEAIEYTAKKFGINLAEESGRHFAREAAEFIGRYGDDGIRALKSTGPDMINLSRRYGDEAVRLCAAHAADGAGYLARNMDQALPVWKQFGKEGTELMVRHPGLARPLLDEFGSKGLQIGRNLTTPDLNRFLVLASKATGNKEKTALVDKVLAEGDKIVAFLWSHRWKIGISATIYTLLKDYDNGFAATRPPQAESAEDSPASVPTRIPENDTGAGPRSFIQFIIVRITDMTLKEYPWLPLVLTGLGVWLMWPILTRMRRLPEELQILYRGLKYRFQRRQHRGDFTKI